MQIGERQVRGFLFDLDGTLYEGGKPIAGAAETIRELIRLEVPHCFVTNTTSKPRRAIVENLEHLKIPANEAQIFTAPIVAAEWLKQHAIRKCFFLLKPELLADLEGCSMETETPEAVVIGDMGEDFSYSNLNRAFRFLIEDSQRPFIALARNRFFKKEEHLNLDVGAFVAALEYSTGRTALNLGKPAPAFFATACASIGLKSEEVAMIGDDLESDVLGAKACGLSGVLVRTGKFREAQLQNSDGPAPDLILDSVRNLMHRL